VQSSSVLSEASQLTLTSCTVVQSISVCHEASQPTFAICTVVHSISVCMKLVSLQSLYASSLLHVLLVAQHTLRSLFVLFLFALLQSRVLFSVKLISSRSLARCTIVKSSCVLSEASQLILDDLYVVVHCCTNDLRPIDTKLVNVHSLSVSKCNLSLLLCAKQINSADLRTTFVHSIAVSVKIVNIVNSYSFFPHCCAS
jgi:hypothetical protein